MAIRKMVIEGDERLRKVCRPVTAINDHILRLIEDMEDTLYEENGVGLAAPQVGVLRRIAIIDTGEEILDLINPHIVASSGSQTGMEGCLSCPGKWGIVTRPMNVTLRATNRKGECYTYEATGLIARAICHETEHLDGILYIDKADRMLTPEEAENYRAEDQSE